MFDGEDDAAARGSVRRRRRWSADQAAIIRETREPGARISEVARRWGVDPQQVYRWRHNEGVTQRRTLRGSHAEEPSFVPIVTDATPASKAALSAPTSAVIEIRLAGAVVRVVSGLDDVQLTAVLRAVRNSARCA